MEIKKGISQMPEYLNQEINYVVPSDGKMYYVLKDGVLENGVVLATLDPKYAFDSSIPCNTVGAFKEDGSVLIDFDKKEIRKIDSDLLLVVYSKPNSKEVIDAQGKESDEISKTAILNNATIITDRLINEMGITGEILFSNAFLEANVYKTDSYNNKVGIDASFIGKNNKELYFYTNDVGAQAKVVRLDAFEDKTEIVEEKDMIEVPNVEEINKPTVDDLTSVENVVSMDGSTDDLKLEIGQDILDGFQTNDSLNETKDEEVKEIEEDSTIEEKEDDMIDSEDIEKEMNASYEMSSSEIDSDSQNKDQVLDNVITVMKKMIEETNKLNERISVLEQEIAEKDKVIEEQESKKDELSDLLDQANEVLDNID